MSVLITCPNCKRVLGTTMDSLRAELYCRGCKGKAQINIKVAHAADYLTNKEEKK